MHVPIHSPKRQNLSLASKIGDKVNEILARGIYLFGEETSAFEREFATFCQRQYCITVANGTDALEIALRAIECSQGDEIITVANAGGYATTACMLTGATPVYVDIQQDMTIDVKSVLRALSPKTKAIIVTHLYGKLVDVNAITNIINNDKITVIEDCSQAHGARNNIKKIAGSFGDIACFSFYPTKNLGAIGDGGAIITNSSKLAEKVRQLRQYGWQKKYHSAIALGRNSRMDEIQAAILRLKLPSLDYCNDRRRKIVTAYREAAKDLALQFVHSPGPDYVAHLCVCQHPERDIIRKQLSKIGIETAIHYPTLDYMQDSMYKKSWRKVDLPKTEASIKQIFTLPCFPEMTDNEVSFVCDNIKRYR